MDHNELTDRLRQLGSEPVDPDVRDEHLVAMAATPVRAVREKRFGRLAVAAAAIVGFMAGSTGLAMAGTFPDQAQGVAHDVLAAVNVEVPDAKERKADKVGPCVSAIASDKTLDDDQKQAGKDQCKADFSPGHDPNGPGNSENTPAADKSNRGSDKHADDPCKGKPDWAGEGQPDWAGPESEDPSDDDVPRDPRAGCEKPDDDEDLEGADELEVEDETDN